VSDEVADSVWVAVGRVEIPSSFDEAGQLELQRMQLGDGSVDRGRTDAQQVKDMAARGLTVVAQRHDRADLPEGEPDGLGCSDEGQPVEHAMIELAVASARSRGGVEQADLLVVAQGLGGDAGAASNLTDEHGLDLPVHWKPYGSGMEIDILYVPDCSNLDRARARVLEALDASGVEAIVREIEVSTAEAAAARGMRGSPTVLIDGRDPFAGASDPTSISCRLYPEHGHADGAPSVAQLVEAVAG